MNREYAVRRANALTRLAYEQRDKPEGKNAKVRLQEHIAKYQLTASDFDGYTLRLLPLLGIVVPQGFTRPRSYSYAPPPPPPRPKYEVKRKFTGQGEYVHEGVCPECKTPFTRRSVKQGNPPEFCSDECHTANRREKARVRMAAKRAAGYTK